MHTLEDLYKLVRNIQISVGELELTVNGKSELQRKSLVNDQMKIINSAISELKLNIASTISALQTVSDHVNENKVTSLSNSIALRSMADRIDRLETALINNGINRSADPNHTTNLLKESALKNTISDKHLE